MEKILDFGCGAGHMVKALSLQKYNAVGVDINEALINVGKSNYKDLNINIINENKIFDFVKKSNFDCLILINVIEHLRDMYNLLNILKI